MYNKSKSIIWKYKIWDVKNQTTILSNVIFDSAVKIVII